MQVTKVAIRMVAAGIIGDLFIKDKLSPSTEAIELLHTLANDAHEDVRFTALIKDSVKFSLNPRR